MKKLRPFDDVSCGPTAACRVRSVLDGAVRIQRRERQPRSHLGRGDRAVAVGVERRVERGAVRQAVDGVDQAGKVAGVVDVEVAVRERAGREVNRRQSREARLQRKQRRAVEERRVAEVLVLLPLEAALERVLFPGVLHRAAHAFRVALVDQVLAEAAALLVGEDARVGRTIDDRVRLLAERRQVGDVAVVLVIRRFDQRRTLKPRVVQAPVVAALDAGAVAGVGQVAIAAAADVRRIVDEHEADRVAARRRVGALDVALILLVLDRAHELLRIERRDVVFTLEPAVAAEEPGAVAVDRAAGGERGVERRELLVDRVLVLGDETGVLEEVVGRTVEGVAARLGDDAREQAGRANELGRDAAGQNLLLLDDLGIEVRTESAADRVGDVDAVEVVEVVARHADVAADVAVVDPRLRRRVAGLLRIVGQNARHELQVALVGAAGRQRFRQLEGDVLSGRRALRVDERRFGRDLHLLGHAADGQADAQRRGLARTHEHVLVARRTEARDLGGDDVLRRRREADKQRPPFRVGHRFTLGDAVSGGGDDGRAGNRETALILDDDFDCACLGDLRHRGAAERHDRHRGEREGTGPLLHAVHWNSSIFCHDAGHTASSAVRIRPQRLATPKVGWRSARSI